MKLSSRLQACADLVRRGNVAADVGADHGYLAIYLLEEHICPFVYASDIREGPLNAARRSAAGRELGDRIAFVRSDGLHNLDMRTIQTVICAGMGGDNIIGILAAEPAVRDPAVQLILQPQSKAADLRVWLADQGFAVLREKLSRDGRFVYTTLEARFDGVRRTLSPGQRFLPPYLLASGDPLLPDYFARVRDSVRLSVNGLHKAKDPDRALLNRYEAALRELNEMEEML